MAEGTKKYWLHRISHEWDVSYKLLEEGYITIGWSCLTSSNIIDCMGDSIDTAMFEKVMEDKGLRGARSRWSLWYFFCFNPGDIVIVPLYSGLFSVYRVTEKPIRITELAGYDRFMSSENKPILRNAEGFLQREDGGFVDIGFVVRAECVKDRISRYEYADNKLTSRMKIRQTNADISDLGENVENVIGSDTPINLYASVIDELSEKLLDAITTQLTPDKFELLVKWYFDKIGSTRAFRPAKNENGKWDGADADIIAEFEPLRIVFYVQVKLHDDITSKWAVEQIAKYKDQHEALVGEYTIVSWVISSARSFSAEAISMAQENNVRLITGTEFARMLLDAGVTDINKAFE